MNRQIELDKLVALTKQKQLVFAYLSCIRALPNSLRFSTQYKFGDPKVFTGTIEMLYNVILNLENYDTHDYQQQFESVDKSAPGTNEFPNYDGTIAQDCGGVFYYSMRLLVDNDVNENLEEISTMLTDAVDAYIVTKDNLEYEDPRFDEKIATDKAMIAEINIQNEIIDYLRTAASIEIVDIDSLTKLQEPHILDLSIK